MNHSILAAAISLLLIPTMGFGQQLTTEDLSELSLEDLFNVKVVIAGKKPISIRETPGIVSVITEREIISSGASDLMEALRLVPGSEYGVDVSGATGMTLRGNMGYIGRVLLMIDGQEVNELLYSCTLSDNHYSVSNIKKIEVIRGPGSAIYGGFAELGVINVITKNGDDLNGVSITANAGQMSGAYSHRNVTVSVGRRIDANMMYSFSGYINLSNRSNRDITDFYGDSYDMTDNSAIRSLTLNASINYKSLGVRVILDDYLTSRRDQWDINLSDTYDTKYKQFLGEIKYGIHLSDNFTLTPKFNTVYSVPWQTPENVKATEDDFLLRYDRRALRNKFSLTAAGDFIGNLNVLIGGEAVYDKARTYLENNEFWNGTNDVSYTNVAGYFEGILKSDFANVTLCARVDRHCHSGTGFAPRVGLTKAWDKFHVKLLLSQAFRSPSIDEIDLSPKDAISHEPEIEPEITQVVEFEIGYLVTPEMSVNANAFASRVDDTIVFTVVEGAEGYINSESSGTKGFEIECLLRKEWGFANLSYSFYSAEGIHKVDYYKVIDETISDDIREQASNETIGSSPHKIAFNGSLDITKKASLSSSFTYIGSEHAYTSAVAQVDSNGDTVNVDGKDVWVAVPTKQDAVFLLNLFVNFKDVYQDGLGLAFGVHNILDAEYNFGQPYNGWHGPMPREGRRFGLKLSYDLRFND